MNSTENVVGSSKEMHFNQFWGTEDGNYLIQAAGGNAPHQRT